MDDARYRKVFTHLPEIETDRLVLKRISAENANDMFAYASLSEVTKYLLWSPHLNLFETKGYIEYLQREYRRGNYADWGLNLKETGVFVGTVGFADIDLKNNCGEIGYVLNPAYQGKGLMTEAVKAVLKVAFEALTLNRVQLRIMEENIPSIRLAERCRFTYEGTFRQAMIVKEKYRTLKVYSMLFSDYALLVQKGIL